MKKNLYEQIEIFNQLAERELKLSRELGTGEFNEPTHYENYKSYTKISEELQKELILKAAQAILDMANNKENVL